MFNRTKTKTVAAAFAAAVALSGCGSDADEVAPSGEAAVPATTAVATSPAATTAGADAETVAWAKKFCGTVTAQTSQLQPPTVNASTPEGTRDSLVAFFTSVVDQQAKQIDAMEAAGPPPSSAGEKAYDKAESDLRDVRKSVAKLVRNIKASTGDSPADVKSLVTDLGKQMTELGSYQGPIADLAKSKSVGAALTAEPSCAVPAG